MLPLIYFLASTMLALPPVDVIPKGHHRVKNEVAFVDSDALRQVRLVAAPIAGFGGVEEIIVGQPFPYSAKYGTKVYAVPADLELEFPSSFKGKDWPSGTVDIGGSGTAPDISPIYGRLTTVKLLAAGSSGIELERVDQVVMDEDGQPVNQSFYYLRIAGFVVLGFVILVTLKRIRATHVDGAAPDPPRTEDR